MNQSLDFPSVGDRYEFARSVGKAQVIEGLQRKNSLMSNLAYIIGIVGAGKGHVAKRLEAELGDRLEVITGDHLLHLARAVSVPMSNQGITGTGRCGRR